MSARVVGAAVVVLAALVALLILQPSNTDTSGPASPEYSAAAQKARIAAVASEIDDCPTPWLSRETFDSFGGGRGSPTIEEAVAGYVTTRMPAVAHELPLELPRSSTPVDGFYLSVGRGGIGMARVNYAVADRVQAEMDVRKADGGTWMLEHVRTCDQTGRGAGE